MRRPLQITFRGIDPSEAVERRVREKFEQLGRFADELTRCHVTVEAPHHHHHRGNLYVVRLVMHLPGKEIVVSRDHERDHAHEDVYVAIRDTFGAATRQLEDYVRERRGEVKHHEARPQPL